MSLEKLHSPTLCAGLTHKCFLVSVPVLQERWAARKCDSTLVCCVIRPESFILFPFFFFSTPISAALGPLLLDSDLFFFFSFFIICRFFHRTAHGCKALTARLHFCECKKKKKSQRLFWRRSRGWQVQTRYYEQGLSAWERVWIRLFGWVSEQRAKTATCFQARLLNPSCVRVCLCAPLNHLNCPVGPSV